MTRTSALGWVSRTVLINGSSTGLTAPDLGAPSRDSRRLTPAAPVVPLAPPAGGDSVPPGAAASLADGAPAGFAPPDRWPAGFCPAGFLAAFFFSAGFFF